jgi:hypothetical protein
VPAFGFFVSSLPVWWPSAIVSSTTERSVTPKSGEAHPGAAAASKTYSCWSRHRTPVTTRVNFPNHNQADAQWPLRPILCNMPV